MAHRLKTLWLMLAAVLAMTAIAASSASASKAYWFTSNNTSDWTVLSGEQAAAFSDEFRIDGIAALGEGVVKCERITYTGSLGVTTTTALTLEANYEGCKLEPLLFGGAPTIHMNGCKYEFHVDSQTTTGGTPNGQFDTETTIVCPKEKDITITMVVAGVTKCVVHIEAQNLGTGIVLTNEEKKASKTSTPTSISKTSNTPRQQAKVPCTATRRVQQAMESTTVARH